MAIPLPRVPKLTMIAAMSKNGVIGQGHRIPWKVKSEQNFFRAVTMGHWCIVGRRTFETLPVLDGRKFAVITTQPHPKPTEDVIYFNSPREAIRELSRVTDHIMIIGGGQIYDELIDEADVIILSTMIMHCPADDYTVFFPNLPHNVKCRHKKHVEDTVCYTIKVWEKEKGFK